MHLITKFVKIISKITLLLFMLTLINDNSLCQSLNFKNKLEIHSEFSKISDVDMDSKGHIYVLDQGEQNIKKFNSHGDYLLTIGKKGKGPGEFQDAMLFEIDKNDNIIVCNFGNYRFDILSSKGEFINSFKMPMQSDVAFMMGVSSFKIDSKNNIVLALIDRYTGTYIIQKWDLNGKILKEYFRTIKLKNSIAEYHRDQHPEMKSEFLFTLDEFNNMYFTFSDEKKIIVLNSIGDTLYHINFNRKPITYNAKEKKRLLDASTKSYIEGYIAGAKSVSDKAPKSIPKSKLPKDTYKYKPYTLALICPKENQLWAISPKKNEPTKLICDKFIKGTLQQSVEINFPSVNLIFNAFQEIILIKNNYLFQIVSDEDELQSVIRYNLD